jgi:thioredoxin 1
MRRLGAIALVVSVVLVVWGCGRGDAGSLTTDRPAAGSEASLPRLVEFGAEWCPPCKQTVPILKELTSEYAGTFRVESIDVDEHKDLAKKEGIEGIPTFIFYDASGQELRRQVGFMSKSRILDTWRELGLSL